MGVSVKDKRALERYLSLCKVISESSSEKVRMLNETSKEQEARIKYLLGDYKAFFEFYFSHYCNKGQTPCADWHIREVKALMADPYYQALWACHRGAAKSVHSNIGAAAFMKQNDEMKFMVLASDTNPKACKLIGSLQAEFEKNDLLLHDFGKQLSYGSWADGEFQTTDGVSFIALGIGESPHGLRERENRPDYIVVDDADTVERCKNPKRVKEGAEWVQESLMGCFGDRRERFICANNYFDKSSIIGTLKKELPKVRWVQIDAVIDANFTPSWPGKYTREYWQKKRAMMSYRAWMRIYMNTPIKEGTIFKDEWIGWKSMLQLKEYDTRIVYCDPSFKSSKKSDFKAIKFWGFKLREKHLIKPWVRQASVSAMVKAFYDLHETIPGDVIVEYWIEGNALQRDLYLPEFLEEGDRRGYQLPIRFDMRAKPDKFGRIESMSPAYETGRVFYNIDLKEDSDMEVALAQLTGFEEGSDVHDDSPDADEGAWWLADKRGTRGRFVPRLGQRGHEENGY